MKQRIDYLKNFGFADEITIVALGINARMSEIQSAYGPLGLKHVDESEYGMSQDALYLKMKDDGVLGRRCVYPLISEYSTYKGFNSARIENLAIAHKVANQVICLPMHHELSEGDVIRGINLIEE